MLVLAGGTDLVAQTQNRETPHFSVSVTERTDIVEEVGTTRRISKEEIETQQARTLDEALRLLPGVYVRTGGAGTPRIDLRGWRSRHVLLLVDGVPVNSTDDGQFDPTEFSTASIREIKVTYGASSLLYGENAVAGVIEISTEPVEKDWFFVHPKYAFHMYGFMQRHGGAAESPIDHNRPASEQKDKFPLFEHVPVYSARLSPGDVLINPPWWWHAINNVTSATIACAVRWIPQTRHDPNPVYSLAQRMVPHSREVMNALRDPEARITDELYRERFQIIETER